MSRRRQKGSFISGVWSRKVVALLCLLRRKKRYGIYVSWQRPYKSLKNQTPQEVHKTSSGGGMILDKYPIQERLSIALRCSGGLSSRKSGLRLSQQYQMQKPGQRRPAAKNLVQLGLVPKLSDSGVNVIDAYKAWRCF